MLLILSVILVSSSAVLYINIKKQHSAEWGHGFLNFTYKLNQLICRKYHRLGYNFWLDLPEKGGALIVANHQTGLDILLLVAISKRPIKFIAAKEYCEMKGLKNFFSKAGCIPVDRKNRNTFALQAALDAVKNGEIVALYPFGGFHLPNEKEPKIKSGVVVIAKETKVPIYSVYISGLRGIGSVFMNIFFPRSKACLELKSIKRCDKSNMDQVLKELSNELSNKINYPGIRKPIELVEDKKESS